MCKPKKKLYCGRVVIESTCLWSIERKRFPIFSTVYFWRVQPTVYPFCVSSKILDSQWKKSINNLTSFPTHSQITQFFEFWVLLNFLRFTELPKFFGQRTLLLCSKRGGEVVSIFSYTLFSFIVEIYWRNGLKIR